MPSFISRYLSSLNLEALVSQFFNKLISLILLCLVFILVKKVATSLFKKTISKSSRLSLQTDGRQKTLIKLFQNLLDYSLYFLLLYWILEILGLPISSLLAGAGIAGLAIGLGAQGFLSDLVNGIFILLERQYDVGETVRLDTISGIVSSVGIRTTEIRDFDGTLHFIPNRHIIVVSNLSRGDMRAQIDIPIYANSHLEDIASIIKAVNKDQVPHFPEIVGLPNVVGPRTSTSGQLVFRVDIFVQNGLQNKIYQAFFSRYQAALLEAGVALPTANIMPSQKK